MKNPTQSSLGTIILMGLFWLCLFALAWLESGCTHFSLPKLGKPFKLTTVNGTAIEQAAQTEVPAKVNSTREERRTVIPAGSDVTFNDKLDVLSAHVNKDLVVSRSMVTETIQAPTPNKPPSPETLFSAQAKADGESRLWWISAGCGVLAVGAFYFGHIKAGVFLVLAAVGFPLLSQLVSALAGYALLLGCVCVAVALWWAWHAVKERDPAFLAELKAKVSSVEAKIESVVKT